MALHTMEELRERQSWNLLAKVGMTEVRIHEWQYQAPWGIEKGVVSFSGGKDSTVLLDIARRLYPDMPAVFCNTGLEYPEIQSFVKRQKNVDIVRPAMRFDEVISTYGYPLIGKEVAEAIYYARRIRRPAEIAGGYYGRHSARKRKELRGKRQDGNAENSEESEPG